MTTYFTTDRTAKALAKAKFIIIAAANTHDINLKHTLLNMEKLMKMSMACL
jgi:hypothetical protein